MKVALRSRTTWIGLGLVFGYWPVAWFIPADPQFIGEHAMRLALGLAIMIAYAPAAFRAIRMPRPSWPLQLVLGVWMSWLGSVGTSALLMLWRLAGHPTWLVQSNLNGWLLWLQVLGGILHLTAQSRTMVPPPPRTDWRWLIGALWLAAFLVVSLAVMDPDLSPFAEWLRPWIEALG